MTLNLRVITIAFPPLEHSDEQSETVELVESVDAAIDAARNEIKTLERLKRSLLQNLLTGRVRVRFEAQAAADDKQVQMEHQGLLFPLAP